MIDEIVCSHLSPSAGFVYGFADMHGLLPEEYKNLPYAISIGMRMDDKAVDTVRDRPTLEYYTHYRSINTALSQISERICEDLRGNGINCVGIFPTISSGSEEFKTYLINLRYKLSHKMVATRAGLGWIGKTDLFISKAFGPRLRLASILIDKPVKPLHPPINKSRCGNCTVCMEHCPSGAANGIPWDIHTDRDVYFNAHKCREKCIELGVQVIGKDALICGICVSVCPLGKKHRKLHNE
jgi:epoxyqueuosine reductase